MKFCTRCSKLFDDIFSQFCLIKSKFVAVYKTTKENRYFSPTFRSKIKIPANGRQTKLFYLSDVKNLIFISPAVLEISAEQNWVILKKNGPIL